ncbi:unnamed protein product [Camellia sinensis]
MQLAMAVAVLKEVCWFSHSLCEPCHLVEEEPDKVHAQPTPVSWEKLIGIDWASVTTNDGKRYYHNTKTKLSSWQIPTEVTELRKKQDGDALKERICEEGIDLDSLTKEQYVHMAKLAEHAKCYEELINFMEKLVLGATPASELIGGGCVGGELAGTCVTASAAVVTGGVVGVGQITASVAVVWADGVLDDVGMIYVVTKLQQEIVMVHDSNKCGLEGESDGP